MEQSKIIEQICRLPRDFKNENKSAIQLILDLGITQQDVHISVKAVSDYLDRDPTLVGEWLLWSQDKRSSEGWYLKQEEGIYIVGYYPNGKIFVFPEVIHACAEFIVREISTLQLTSR